MKKIIAILLVFALFASCKKLTDLNKNTKDPSTTTGESLFTGAQKKLFEQMVTSNVNYNIWRLIDQYWNETTYLDETNYNLVNRTIPDNHWDRLYEDVLKNLTESSKIITSTTYADPSPAVKQNKLKIVDIMSVYAWSVLVETFGNIPYSQAFNSTYVLPVYDDGKTVYKDLIARLDVDLAGLDANWGSFDAADNMYQGDVSHWIKFANSLKLRMGMVLADDDPAFSQATVNSVDFTNLISSNADNAVLIYLGSAPNTNPMYEDQVASGRHDFVAANTLVDTMNNLNDPRRPFYFTQVDTSSIDTIHKYAYLGANYGHSSNYHAFSHAATAMWLPTFPGTIFEYSEVEFLLAEAVERGGYTVTGTAESHYNNAITASIEYWGGATSDAVTYLAQPNVAYATAPGNFKQKIGVQQWIAYYNRGFEGWTEQRRMDFPVLIPGPNALSAYPVRYTYPIEEQTLNGANYNAASTAIGGDLVTTKLFWDKY